LDLLHWSSNTNVNSNLWEGLMKYKDLLINDMFIIAPFKKDREKELSETFCIYIKGDGAVVKRIDGSVSSMPADMDIIKIE